MGWVEAARFLYPWKGRGEHGGVNYRVINSERGGPAGVNARLMKGGGKLGPAVTDATQHQSTCTTSIATLVLRASYASRARP